MKTFVIPDGKRANWKALLPQIPFTLECSRLKQICLLNQAKRNGYRVTTKKLHGVGFSVRHK